MTRYKVQYDFAKYQPQWGNDMVALFGRRNEGALIEADSDKAALKAFGDKHNLNHFYLKAVAA